MNGLIMKNPYGKKYSYFGEIKMNEQETIDLVEAFGMNKENIDFEDKEQIKEIIDKLTPSKLRKICLCIATRKLKLLTEVMQDLEYIGM